MEPVTISDLPMTQEELVAVAQGTRLVLGEPAKARIAASRALLEDVVSRGEAIYGLSTSVGHGKDTRVPPEVLERLQQFLVSSHGGSFGPLLDRTLVRAAMTVRVCGMARGGSGASLAAAETLLAMLNAGVHPNLTAPRSRRTLPKLACQPKGGNENARGHNRGQFSKVNPPLLRPGSYCKASNS